MKTIITYLFIFAAGVAATFVLLHYQQEQHDGTAMNEAHHGMQSSNRHHEGGQHIHDEVNMPGLQGKDTTQQEVSLHLKRKVKRMQPPVDE